MTRRPTSARLPVSRAEFDIARERGDRAIIARYLREGGKVDPEFFMWLADLLDPPSGQRRELRFGWRGKGAPPNNVTAFENGQIGEAAERLYRHLLTLGKPVNKGEVAEQVANEFSCSKRRVEDAWHAFIEGERALLQSDWKINPDLIAKQKE